MNHRPKKQFGQNFLTDKNILKKIVDKADLTKNDNVLEIGPGKGFLTDILLEKAQNVLAIEIDYDLCDFLKQKYDSKNFVLSQGDCLKLDWRTQNFQPNKLIANIPYNITSQILFKMFDYRQNFEKSILMMQLEVADRIIAKHDSKVYGVLSCILQKFWDIDKFAKIPPTVFYPAPDVDSALVEFKPKKSAENIDNNEIKRYINFVKFCFMQRRKILLNRLVKEYGNDIAFEKFYEENGLNKKIRPENISVDLFWELFLVAQTIFKYEK